MPLKNGRSIAAAQSILVGSVIPAGTIAPFGGGTVPTGWLLCDGSQVSRTTYSALFSAVGTVHGTGDGSTTFHLPDYRGRFLRGADNMGTGGAGRDPDAGTRTAPNAGGATGAGVGSVQNEEVLSHFHGSGTNASYSNGNGSTSYGSRNLGTHAGQGTASSQIRTTALGGNETRPQNANTLCIIKI